jgi:hypothetical protein
VVLAPVIVGVGIVAGGSAITVELLCASRNHPDEVKKVEDAADEFLRRSNEVLRATPKAVDDAKASAISLSNQAKVEIVRVAGDVFEYANLVLPGISAH